MFDEVEPPRHFRKYGRVLLFWFCSVFVIMRLVLSGSSFIFMSWIWHSKLPLAFWQNTLGYIFGFKMQLFDRIEGVIMLRTWSLLFVGIGKIVDEHGFIPREFTRKYGMSLLNTKTCLPLLIQETHLV